MSQITLYAIGDWQSLPAIETRFVLSLEAFEAELREQLLRQAPEAGFRGAERRALGRASVQLVAELHFEGEHFESAIEGAQLLRALADQGPVALFYEGSEKLYTPTVGADIDPEDRVCLLHLYLEIWGENASEARPGRVVAEGLEAFGLPDIWVLIDSAAPGETTAAAQGLAFALSARITLEGERFELGECVRASASKPIFKRCPIPTLYSEEESERNPNGVLCFQRAEEANESAPALL